MSDETIPQMRETIESLQKAVKEKDESIGKLNGDLRVRDAREAFRKAGFNPKHGDLFADKNPEGEITEQSVKDFAVSWDLAPAASEGGDGDSSDGGDSTSDVDDGTDALGSLARGGTRAGEGGGGSATQQTLTRQEWQELQVTDPVAASQALSQGRVLISTSGNLKAGQTPVRGGNPYEPQVAE